MSKFDILFSRVPHLIKRDRNPDKTASAKPSEQTKQGGSPLQKGWQPISCKRLEILGRRLYSTSKMGMEDSDRVKGYGIIEIKEAENMDESIHLFAEEFPEFIKVYLEKTELNRGIFHIMQHNMSGRWIDITEQEEEVDISFA